MAKKRKARVTERKMAGKDHAVLTVVGGKGDQLVSPCPECPWRRVNVGNFPPEAFKHSATTAYDMALNTFACHMRGAVNPATCAGFLAVGAMDNLAIRMKHSEEKIKSVTFDPDELFGSYKEMAVANGVDPDDPVLAPCMPEAREIHYGGRRRGGMSHGR